MENWWRAGDQHGGPMARWRSTWRIDSALEISVENRCRAGDQRGG
eukprot:CAMPEP_0171918512 /NCGR_PEP_ID=MMETSP0993-20121228/17257_1 /TAXON_ID=483369 /ORGANISM="non described non described, Strain CCMP2098" /LENGTH=44 /DNA_ID= /DNA_START= /DNA_END= /DNA_ORIENTATION=